MEESNRSKDAESARTLNGGESDYSSTHESVNKSSTDVNKNDDDLRTINRVLELDSKGFTQQEIADAVVGISQPTVSRYLKQAHESAVKSRTEYVRYAMHDLERTRMGQDRALKGLWSIAEDPISSFSDRLRAYSLIIQCNTRKNQSTSIARALSQWMDSEEQAQKKKEDSLLTDDERLIRSFERESQRQTKASDSDPVRDISAFMREL